MADLILEGLSKSFGKVTAVKDVDLTVEEGAFVSFLGPSGCGKTTLLRLIAGLEKPDRGRILIGGADVTAAPPYSRNIGMVFQSLALFPHLTAGENISYGLRVKGRSRIHCRATAERLLELLQLPDAVDRRIDQLSGGQQQRVAIARALALEPPLFLLDEPMSALDAKLREAMQVELRLLQQRLGITTIMVTHDQREAMTVSDVIVVMDHAVIQQSGPPMEVYNSPRNSFVADFIGSSNIIAVRVASNRAVAIGGQELPVGRVPEGLRREAGVSLLIRPEKVVLLPPGATVDGALDGKVAFIRELGASSEVLVECAEGIRIAALVNAQDRVMTAGQAVKVHLPAEACSLLER